MNQVNIKINRTELNTQISNIRGAALDSHVTRIAKEEYFYPAVYEMIDEFENHPVTQEIDGGIDAENISDTLKGNFKNDEGKNLYSFIGFNAGSNPTQDIREFLDPKHKDGPKFNLVKQEKGRLIYTFQASTPKLDEIYGKTPMPWATGLSWVKRIEIGIPGLGRFLNKIGAKNSRSGGGIQIQRELRPARYTPVRYLSEIFNNFIRKFR